MSKFIDKYNCILCKYKKYNTNDNPYVCQEYKENNNIRDDCHSLSNIYYGKIIEHFPFKQLYDLYIKIESRKYEKYNKEMEEKYGDYALETDELKFVWGIKSWDDLSKSDANIYTMNDIDIIYDKEEKKYFLGVETAYLFKDYTAECNYLRQCLDAFTKYMDDNGLDKNKHFDLFFENPCTSTKAESIEALYTNFKIFVDGFCDQCDIKGQ